MKLFPLVACVAFAGSALAQSDALLVQNGYLSINDSPDLRPATFTLECWFRPDGPGNGNYGDPFGSALVARPGQGTAGSHLESYGIYWADNGQHVLVDVAHTFYTDGVTLVSTQPLPVGEWHHVAATFDGSSLLLYVDGKLDNQTTTSFSSIDYSRPDPVLIGASNFSFGYTRRFVGGIDDVRIWDHPRTRDEIAATWNSQGCGPRDGLIAEWTFTAGSLSDISGNGHTAYAMEDVVTFTDPPPGLFASADFNNDGFVDFFDFNDFVNCFEGGSCPPGASADFNHDGFADFFDFNDFVSAFEAGC